MENRCVCCGEIIPEGRQICYSCECGIVKTGIILQTYEEHDKMVAKSKLEQ